MPRSVSPRCISCLQQQRKTCTAIWAVLVCVGQGISVNMSRTTFLPPTSNLVITVGHVETFRLRFSLVICLVPADGFSAWLVESSPRGCPGSRTCSTQREVSRDESMFCNVYPYQVQFGIVPRHAAYACLYQKLGSDLFLRFSSTPLALLRRGLGRGIPAARS